MHRIVPDSMREREPLSRGRTPSSELSRDLLAGKTVIVDGPKKTFGSLYLLAKKHGMQAHTKRTEINGIEGTLVWFDGI